MSDERRSWLQELSASRDASTAGVESVAECSAPDLLLLTEALAQVIERDRVPPARVVRYLVDRHGISWVEAVAEIKSFATGH